MEYYIYGPSVGSIKVSEALYQRFKDKSFYYPDIIAVFKVKYK